jgi:hypothetical protein
LTQLQIRGRSFFEKGEEFLKTGRAGKPKEGNGKEGKEAKRPSNAETPEGWGVLEGRQRAQFFEGER